MDRQEETNHMPGKQEKVEDSEITKTSKQSSSGSESSSEEDVSQEDDKEEKEMMSKRVTEADLNALGAKRLKAELMGNEVYHPNNSSCMCERTLDWVYILCHFSF